MGDRKNHAQWVESRQRWQINVQQDGKRRTFTSTTPGERGQVEAERKADRWLERGVTSGKDMRLGQLYTAFLAYKKEFGSKADYKSHEWAGRIWILPLLKHRRSSTITDRDWQNVIDKAFKKGLHKKSLMDIRGSMTAVAAYAKMDKIPLAPPDKDLVKIPRDALEGERKILQPEQARLLFARDYIMHYGRKEPCFFIHAWRFEMLTGMRPGEVAGLQRSRDAKKDLLNIRRAINIYNDVTHGKNDNALREMVPFRQVQEVLDAQAAMLKRLGISSLWLFPDEDGGPMKPKLSYSRWCTYRSQHGITSSLYELRHTMVSMAQHDLPESLLKRVVGHSKNMDTYGVYGHEVDGDLKRAATILEQVFDRILGPE